MLQSCDSDKAGSWKNDQINASKREDFHQLNDEAFTDLKADNPKHLQHLLSKELIDNHSTNHTVELISNSLKVNSYSLLDEYYVINKWRADDTIETISKGMNSYSLYYPGTAKEMCIAFFVPKFGEDKYLITTIYAKYDYGWKLSKLDLSPYTVNGKTAPELFKLAKEQYDKKYLVDAVNTMAAADKCLRPAEIWQYPVEEDLRTFYGKIINEANKQYQFPFTLKDVPTHPQIFRIFNQSNPEGTFPMIYYLSGINLKDTLALKRENALIKKVIGKAIPGIDKDKKYLLYAAFNTKPAYNKEADRYYITQKLQ
jgi:hypothetical protein